MTNMFSLIYTGSILAGAALILVGCFYLIRNTRQHNATLESLRQKEEKYRLLIKTIPSIVFKGYADGSADFFDDKLEALTGYAVDEFNSHKMKWADLILPEDMEGAKEIFLQALKRDKFYVRDYRIRTKAGNILWIQEKGHIVCDENGKIDYITGICSDITQKHNMEVALQENEKNFRMLVKTLPSVVYRGYADWSVDFFDDDKFEKVTGYTIDQFNSRRKKWNEIIVPEDLEGAKQKVKAALQSEDKSYMREYRIKIKSGEILWIRERGKIVLDENGMIEHISGVCSDITAQHEMEDTLRKMQHHNELILNSLGEGLVEIDQDGEVVFVNPAASNLSGFEGRELMGQSLHSLTHYKKEDGSPYPVTECPIHATLKDGESRFVTDDIFWTKKGEAMPVAYRTNAIVEDGRITGVVMTYRDITWRKKAEAELKRTNQYMENIFDNSAESIGIVDRHGIIRKWNKASESIYGYSFKDLEGKTAADLYANKEELSKMVSHLRQHGFVKNYEITMMRKDGTTFPCSLSIKVLRDEKGHNMGSVTVARDLTDLKEKEAKLQAANKQLQALVDESDERNRHMILLQEMSDVFQSCQTSGETYSAIAHFAPKFFTEYSGALYLLNNTKHLFEMTALWGGAPPAEMAFEADECWSLRRTRAYLVADSGTTMNCRHVNDPMPGSYLCVPMMAQGEIMGILHMRKPTQEQPEQLKSIGQFATTVAEAMALALANLKLRETLRNQAIRDGLTGLFNRRYLEETMDRELSRGKRQGNPLGVIMMDLDHFKDYNDTYGHNAGDELLCALGELIQEQVRREDIACRYGGEEFLLIMPGASLEVVLDRANEINNSVKRLHTTSSALKPITISAGVAVFPQHGATGKDVVRAADGALYRAKEEGRDRVIVAGSSSTMAAAN